MYTQVCVPHAAGDLHASTVILNLCILYCSILSAAKMSNDGNSLTVINFPITAATVEVIKELLEKQFFVVPPQTCNECLQKN